MICRVALWVFVAAYLGALALLAIGTFGLFGSPRGPLAVVFLLPLGMPWTIAAGLLPDGPLRIAGVLAAPLLNLGILAGLCRWLQRS